MWVIKSDITDDLVGIDRLIDKIANIITPPQFWAAIEGARINRTPEEVLDQARKEAKEQELESPDDFTWNTIDDYLEALIVDQGWTYNDIRDVIEAQYPQVLK